jgi:hypothetical protein
MAMQAAHARDQTNEREEEEEGEEEEEEEEEEDENDCSIHEPLNQRTYHFIYYIFISYCVCDLFAYFTLKETG